MYVSLLFLSIMNYGTWKDRRKNSNPYVFAYEFELID